MRSEYGCTTTTFNDNLDPAISQGEREVRFNIANELAYEGLSTVHWRFYFAAITVSVLVCFANVVRGAEQTGQSQPEAAGIVPVGTQPHGGLSGEDRVHAWRSRHYGG